MKVTSPIHLTAVASSLAMAILLGWCLSALALDQSLFASQKSRLLLELGAANGNVFGTHEWWRILSSQFLHVHFLHMLFNAGCILAIGGFIEAKTGWYMLLLAYFVGGSLGQTAGVFWNPQLVSTGASQALMALCGAALVTVSGRSPRLLVIAIVGIQAILDLYAAQTLKAGHTVGFIAGLLIGATALILNRSRTSQSESNTSM